LDYDEITAMATIQQRNHFKPGQEVEFFGPNNTSFKQTLETIYDEAGNSLDAAKHPLQRIQLKVQQRVKPLDMMRKKKTVK
jgi:U32 family peptidase